MCATIDTSNAPSPRVVARVSFARVSVKEERAVQEQAESDPVGELRLYILQEPARRSR